MIAKFFIGGFPMDADELELAKLIAPFGDISTIKIVRDRKTGNCKGYAFVEMENRLAAENAIEALHETEIDGRQLTLRIVEETAKAPAKKEFIKPAVSSNYRKTDTTEIKKKRPRKTF
jgi:RNA recognition motif-containing protein